MPQLEVNFSSLNFTRAATLTTSGELFNDFLKEAGYDGAEITVLRSPLLRRMLGKHAAEITTGLHAPFAGRTFPEVSGDLLRHGRGPNNRNVKGLFYTVAMREVERALPSMVAFQKQLGKGGLDAVLYPQSGDSPNSLNYNADNAPFARRTFQVTAEVLHRWGISFYGDISADDLVELTKIAMAEHGFTDITLDGLHSRRVYQVAAEYGSKLIDLPAGYIEALIEAGLVANFHVSVGRKDVLKAPDPLLDISMEEAALLRDDPAGFALTEQGVWVREAAARYKGPGKFRVTLEQPESVSLKQEKGKIVVVDQQKRIVRHLHAL